MSYYSRHASMTKPFLPESLIGSQTCTQKSLERLHAGKQQLTIAEKVARMSAVRVELERSRKRRDTSKRVTASRPQERQMDTALVDQADWKLILGPTCTFGSTPPRQA